MNDARKDAPTPGSSSVDAYEEDWYRSLRALAERRRTELEQFDDEPEESEPDRQPGRTSGAEAPTPGGSPVASAGTTTQRPAPADAVFWATPPQPARAEEPSTEPLRSAPPTIERAPSERQPGGPATEARPAEPTARPGVGSAPPGAPTEPPVAETPRSAPEAPSGVWTTRRPDSDVWAVKDQTPAPQDESSAAAAGAAGAEATVAERAADEPKAGTGPTSEVPAAGVADAKAADVRGESGGAVAPTGGVPTEPTTSDADASDTAEEPSGTWARILRPLKRFEPSPVPEPQDESAARTADAPTGVEPSSAGDLPERTPADVPAADVPGRATGERPPEAATASPEAPQQGVGPGGTGPAPPPDTRPTRVWSARAMVPEARVDTTRGTIEGPRRGPDATETTPQETGRREPEAGASDREDEADRGAESQAEAPALAAGRESTVTPDVARPPTESQAPTGSQPTQAYGTEPPGPQPAPESPTATPPLPPEARLQAEPATSATEPSAGTEPPASPTEPQPTAESQPQIEPPTPPALPSGPLLTSRDPAERKTALVALENHEATAAELETVAALILDPDAEIRRLAVDTLARTRVRLDDGVVRQALQDPSDDVRAAAVRAAATRGMRDLPSLAPLIDARHSPQTHRTVLELLPKILGEAPLTADDIDPLLLAVAQMQTGPAEDERGALSDIAAAIGTALLIEGLTLPDVRRLGAVRLLAGDRSHAVLHALADRAGDPLEEVRQAGLAASEEIARIEAEAAGAAGPPDIGALADELRSPDAEHVQRSRTALGNVERSDVVAWSREKLARADAESVATVAAVAAVVDLNEIGAELLTRGAALPSERRRPVVEALADFPDPSPLALLLTTVPADTRPDAVRLVWEAAGSRVLPELRALLADPAVEVRVAVIDIVREADDPASIEAVTALLASDASPDVRAAAVRTIAPTEGALANVTGALGDPDAHVRVTAVESMPSAPAAEVGQALAQALTDLDERVRLAAIDRLAGVSRGDPALAWSALRRCRVEERAELLGALQRTNPEQVLEIALEHLSSPDQEERKLAVEMTGWGASQGAVEAAIRVLADPLPEIRRAAVDALGRLRDRSAVAALGNRLGDPDPAVRVAAVRALGVIDDEGVLAFLVAALKDPDHEVRETTSHVLTEWSSPAVAKRLAGVLAVPSLRDSATDLLRRIGPTSVELLIDVLLQGGADLRSTVGPLLEQIVGVDDFLRRMDSLEPERRLRAIEALGAIAGPMAIDALTRSLADPDERIRLRSTQLLGELGDPVATDAIRRLVDDPVAEVAAAARHALEANAAGRAAPPAAE